MELLMAINTPISPWNLLPPKIAVFSHDFLVMDCVSFSWELRDVSLLLYITHYSTCHFSYCERDSSHSR